MSPRALAVATLLCAPIALADEAPANACRGDLTVGSACTMDDGTPGTCVNHAYTWEVDGRVHSATELICVAAVSAAERRLVPWLGAGLAFLALVAALASRPSRGRRAGAAVV